MKTTILAIATMLFSLAATAQHAWWDAVALSDFFAFDSARYRVEIDNSVEINANKVLDVVRNYCPNAVTYSADSTSIKVNTKICFDGNPYISMREYANSGAASSFLTSETKGGPGGLSEGTASLVPGGNLVTRIADGLAIFLVKRTKEELNAAFFDGLRRQLQKEPAYKVLFPATHDLLEVIGTEIYNYNAYLESLRASFTTDLEALPGNFRQFSIDHDFIKKPQHRMLAEDALAVTQLVLDDQPPMDVLHFLAHDGSIQNPSRWEEIGDTNLRTAMQDMAMSLRSLDLMASSMENNDGGWPTQSEVSSKMKDIEHMYLYLGLLWQQSQGIRFSNGLELRSGLSQLDSALSIPISVQNYLSSLAQKGKNLQTAFEQLVENRELNQATTESFKQLYSEVLDLLESAQALRRQLLLPRLKPTPGGGQAPTNAEELPSENTAEATEKKLNRLLRHAFALKMNITQRQYVIAVSDLTVLLSELLDEENFKYKKDFLRYSTFIATVAEANDSRQIAAAIELFALPPGSSRMKKQSKWSVSLNAYGGLAYGWEQDFDKAVNDALEDKSVLATSAPLGIDFNYGLGDKGSLSLYAQLIDVGAIFAYRFTNETSNIPELTFQNILAPGFYGIYGFGNNVPVSLGIGAQLGPNLRKIDPTAGLQVDQTSAWRFGFILSVDIPVTHFYTR